jgi:hypothetical protein
MSAFFSFFPEALVYDAMSDSFVVVLMEPLLRLQARTVAHVAHPAFRVVEISLCVYI